MQPAGCLGSRLDGREVRNAQGDQLDPWDRDHPARANLDQRELVRKFARPSAHRKPATIWRPAGHAHASPLVEKPTLPIEDLIAVILGSLLPGDGAFATRARHALPVLWLRHPDRTPS